MRNRGTPVPTFKPVATAKPNSLNARDDVGAGASTQMLAKYRRQGLTPPPHRTTDDGLERGDHRLPGQAESKAPRHPFRIRAKH